MSNTLTVTRCRENLSAPKILEIAEVMEDIRVENGKHTVSEYRYYLEKTGCQDEKSLHAIPRIIFGGTFKRKKNGSREQETYNGVVTLEIGNLASVKEAATLRDSAAEALQTLAAFIGFDHKSVVILTRFSLPDGTLPQDGELVGLFHAHAYKRTLLFYSELLQYPIEGKVATAFSPVCQSADEQLYFNPEAAVIRMKQPFGKPAQPTFSEHARQESNPLLRLMPGLSRSSIISTLFENCFQKACERYNYREADNFKPFLTTLAELCFQSSIPEEDTVRWTLIHIGFRTHADETSLTIHSVYASAEGFGRQPCMSKEQTLVYQLQEFMKRRFDIRYNMMKMDLEYRERRSLYFDFHPLDERGMNSISIRAHREGINVWDKDVKRYVCSDAIPLYWPIDDYLYNLPQWDGKDHIRRLALTVTCTNGNWSNLFYKWFLNMVAHWVKPNGKHANSVSPLLVGAQGCGKSTWCRNLIPPALQEYYTDSFDLSSKRKAEMLLTRFALINIDEFDSIGVNQQAYLKHILQKATVNTAAPYQSSIRNYKRFASFIGTSNNFDLLTDPTGSRRFVCIAVEGDIDNSSPIDYEQLYAQALAAIQSGEQYWYTRSEEQEIMEANAPFQQEGVEEQLFHEYFRIPEIPKAGEWLSPVAIMQVIQKKSGFAISNKRAACFGRTLHKLQIASKRTNAGTVYFVERR